MRQVREEFPSLCISGVIEPGAKAAARAAGSRQFPTIGVIATEATVRSRAYEHAIARRRHHARVYCAPAPLLVPIIEEGRKLDDPLARLAVEQYLKPLLERGINVLVLGCTHYPALKGLIMDVAGPKVEVIDSAQQCAEDVTHRLQASGLLRGDKRGAGALRCYVTDDSPRFAMLASRFVGAEVGTPTWVATEDLYEAAFPRAARREASPSSASSANADGRHLTGATPDDAAAPDSDAAAAQKARRATQAAMRRFRAVRKDAAQPVEARGAVVVI
jgi:glutamate racemase